MPAKTYKFIVSSAPEAVQIVREKLGKNAKVVSVKQVGGRGLARFLASPKLEIIATDESVSIEQKVNFSDLPPTEKAQNVNESFTTSKWEEPLEPVTTSIESGKFLNVLEKIGFSRKFLDNFQSQTQWAQFDYKPLEEALQIFIKLLANAFERQSLKPLSRKVAFLGVAGAGKTTCLCKQTAQKVFLEGTQVHLAKIELQESVPNPDTALQTFCDVLNVSLWREEEIATFSDSICYVDSPGVSVSRPQEWKELGDKLNRLGVDTRILVVNAAYDISSLEKIFKLSYLAGTTHVGFSHIDELESSAKLWPFILQPRLSPLFLSYGQDVTSNFSFDVLDKLLLKSFPGRMLEVFLKK